MEGRQAVEPRRSHHLQQPADVGEWRLRLARDHGGLALYRDAPVFRGDYPERISADERVASPALASFHAFEKEGIAARLQPQERADRRLGIGQDLTPHGNHGIFASERAESLRVGMVACLGAHRQPVEARSVL